MQKRLHFIPFLSAAILSLFILSCASLPASRTDTGTILIIPTAHENDGSMEWFGGYRITVRNTDSGALRRYLLPNEAEFFAVTDLAPGNYAIVAERFIRKGIDITPVMSIRQNYYERDFPFILSAGGRTILDFCSVTVMENRTMDKKWIRTTDTDRLRLETLLEETPVFSSR